MASFEPNVGTSATIDWNGETTLSTTYRLSAAKRCIITGLGTDKSLNSAKDSEDGVSWTFYGELTDDCLKNLGYSFSENWEDGTALAEQEAEKLIKPVTAAMKAVVSKFTLFKDLDISLETSNIKGTITMLAALAGAIGGVKDKEVARWLNALEYGYRYHIPVRTALPDIGPTSNNITIEFAYGKCNMFDAYKEVWCPLQAIKTQLFPSITKSDEAGLVKGSNNVLFPQQVSAGILKQMFSGDALANITGGIKSFKDVATNLGSGDEYADWTVRDTKKISKGDFEKIKKKSIDTNNINQTGLTSEATKVTLSGDTIEQGLNDDNKYDKELSAENVKSAVQSLLDTFKDNVKTNAGTDANVETTKINYNISDFKSGKGPKGKVTYKSNDNMDTLQSAITNFVNFIPIQVGKYTDEKAKGGKSILYGFPNFTASNLQELYKKCFSNTSGGTYDSSGEYTFSFAAVAMTNVLVKKASISFDFEHRDERGYPMSGKLKIESLWNLDYPAFTFKLQSYNANKIKEDWNTVSPITYENSED